MLPHHGPTPPRLLLFALALWAASATQAQLSVSLKTDRKHYLRYEPVEITVVLHNYSGNTLIFGDDEGANQGYLRFAVERPEGQEVRALDRRMNPVIDLILGAGESRQLALNLNDFFDLHGEGSYVVTAQIGHKRLPNDFRSEPASFDVREGSPVIARSLGLPQADPAAQIKGLTVSLLLFHDGDGWVYCLRAETEDAVLGTVRLGPQIAGSQPQMDADAASDIHVLVQVQSRLFLYAVYGLTDTGIRLRQRRYYKPDEYGPRLTQAPGYLKVVGGVPTQEGTEGQTPTPGAAPTGTAPATPPPARAGEAAPPAPQKPAQPAHQPAPAGGK
jgi:hypothetical protein